MSVKLIAQQFYSYIYVKAMKYVSIKYFDSACRFNFSHHSFSMRVCIEYSENSKKLIRLDSFSKQI